MENRRHRCTGRNCIVRPPSREHTRQWTKVKFKLIFHFWITWQLKSFLARGFHSYYLQLTGCDCIAISNKFNGIIHTRFLRAVGHLSPWAVPKSGNAPVLHPVCSAVPRLQEAAILAQNEIRTYRSHSRRRRKVRTWFGDHYRVHAVRHLPTLSGPKEWECRQSHMLVRALICIFNVSFWILVG